MTVGVDINTTTIPQIMVRKTPLTTPYHGQKVWTKGIESSLCGQKVWTKGIESSLCGQKVWTKGIESSL